ncbi:glutathione-disulfide reductase [Luteimonas lutimaris]|uniref:Glutathione-disulfide reductase n=1 Tax=Luteimonas lutimaris TaxID=698645 RepID=A0ABP7MI34_9GAMM
MAGDGQELDFDLVVIGGGSGGLAAAFRAAEHGARVAMLEPGELGGTCVNAGCVPKKAMWLAARIAGDIGLAAQLGFAAGAPTLDWCEFITHRQRYIANIHASYRRRLDAAGIVAVSSRGRLVDAHTVECVDGVRLRAAHVVLATGGRPRRPSIPGAELGLVSDDFFQFTAAPARVAIIGGGYIGVELAGLLGMLGSEVTMFVRGPRVLHHFDAELAGRLQENYRQSGIALHLDRDVRALSRGPGDSVCVDGDGEGFDAVLFATGRRPNTDGLGLEAAGVETDAGGHVCIDAWQDTGVEGVHAVGDVTDRVALTPVAIAAARRLADRLFGGVADAKLDYEDIPTVVFSHPPLATVGLTADRARELHGSDAVHEYRADFRDMLHALADVPQRSLFKLVCVGAERRVAGIHLLGEGVDEILQGFAVALKKGITLDDLRDTVAIHPTSAEEVVLMR